MGLLKGSVTFSRYRIAGNRPANFRNDRRHKQNRDNGYTVKPRGSAAPEKAPNAA